MPWSFSFQGHPVTHENERCYLIMGKPGQDLRFTHPMCSQSGQTAHCGRSEYPGLGG
jgi:hypothetical protein